MNVSRPLPSLALLATFEVAGRYLSFKRAAEELHVTPSAVSHQIRQLEAFMGFPLFRRLNRALAFTPAGEDYWRQVSEAMALIRAATEQNRARFGKPQVRASIMPFLANEIVVPRLHEFQEMAPDVELRLEVSSVMVDMRYSDMDIAVRYGRGHWPGVIARKVMSVAGAPVCSPEFLKEHPMEKPGDIVDKPIITIASEPDAWRLWSTHVGIPPFEPVSNLAVDNLLAQYLAAEKGLGIAIGVFPLVNQWLASGRLVAPFDERVSVEEAYYLVYRETDSNRPEIQKFSQWLIDIFGEYASIT